MTRAVIALLTDFGTRDHYVASVKGSLLAAAPEARIVDVTHEVAFGDVLAGAWLLAAAWRDLPAGTVFLGVVDPGVGSERHALALRAHGRFGVGPDNGLFALVARDAPDLAIVELTRHELWRHPVSPVFHGRDVFAPVAGALAAGRGLADVGTPIDALVELPLAWPERRPDGTVVGHVIHVDRFGNVVTDVPRRWLPDAFEVRVGEARVRSAVDFYAAAPGGEPVALVNSAGYLEIAVRGGSAAKRLGIRRGHRIEVRAA